MLTDRPPRKPALLAVFLNSDRTISLDIPQDNGLEAAAKLIESSLDARQARFEVVIETLFQDFIAR